MRVYEIALLVAFVLIACLLFMSPFNGEQARAFWLSLAAAVFFSMGVVIAINTSIFNKAILFASLSLTVQGALQPLIG